MGQNEGLVGRLLRTMIWHTGPLMTEATRYIRLLALEEDVLKLRTRC